MILRLSSLLGGTTSLRRIRFAAFTKQYFSGVFPQSATDLFSQTKASNGTTNGC